MVGETLLIVGYYSINNLHRKLFDYIPKIKF